VFLSCARINPNPEEKIDPTMKVTLPREQAFSSSTFTSHFYQTGFVWVMSISFFGQGSNQLFSKR